MQLSIVTTLYNSASYIEQFCERTQAACRELAIEDFEIVLVNDGSPDNSLEIAKKMMGNDNRTLVVDLSRNFGHHNAIMAGLAVAKGDYIFLIDVDLEEDPFLLLQFHDMMFTQSNNVDVVYGVQAEREGQGMKRVFGNIFWRSFNMLSQSQIHKNPLTVRLMRRKYVDALLQFQERELFLAGIFSLAGFNQLPVYVKKSYKGITTYKFGHQIRLFVNAVTSFSNAPLKSIFYLGVTIAAISLISLLYIVSQKLIYNEVLIGWSSLIISIWLVGGLTMFSIGVVGIYIYKIFSEVKSRPTFIVRQVYKKD